MTPRTRLARRETPNLSESWRWRNRPISHELKVIATRQKRQRTFRSCGIDRRSRAAAWQGWQLPSAVVGQNMIINQSGALAQAFLLTAFPYSRYSAAGVQDA